MNEFTFISNGAVITTIILLSLLIIGTVLSVIFDSRKGTFRSSQDKVFKLLDTKFDMNLITDKSDITILFDSYGREISSSYSLAPLLEDYLKYLLLQNFSESNNIKERYAFYKKIIEEESKEKPFADIPEEERRILRSLKDAIDHNDSQSILFNLDELSALISARNRLYTRTDKINRWSIPLAIMGLITTVIFGIMSLTMTLDHKKVAKTIATELKKSHLESHKGN